MAGYDDDDPFDIPMAGDGQAEEDDDDPFNIPVAGEAAQDAGPAREDHWYDGLLSGIHGAGMNVADEMQGAARYALGKAGVYPEVGTLGENMDVADAEWDQRNAAHPIAHGAGTLATGIAGGVAAGPAIGAQMAVAGGQAALGELADSHDPMAAAGAGAFGAGTAGAFGKVAGYMGSEARQAGAMKRMLTQGDPRAVNSLDNVLGGARTEGTSGQGVEYAVQRARELSGGGRPDMANLQSAANESVQALRQGPMSALDELVPKHLQRYQKGLERFTADPTGASWTSKGVVQRMQNERAAMLAAFEGGEREAMDETLKQYTADVALSGIAGQKPPGFATDIADMALNSRGGSFTAAALKKGAKSLGGILDNTAFGFSEGTQAGIRGAGGAAAVGAAGLGDEMGPSTAKAQTAQADAPTLSWTLQSVLSSGNTGLDPQDEQQLTEAVVNGDVKKIASLDWQLKQRSPRYAKRIEDELKALNDEGL